MGYTGKRYQPSAGEASRNKIDRASRGSSGGLTGKLQLIEDYILNAFGQAGIAKAVCPSSEEWSRLASGRHPMLPNEAQLHLYADEVMRRLIRNGGNLREICFERARKNLLSKTDE